MRRLRSPLTALAGLGLCAATLRAAAPPCPELPACRPGEALYLHGQQRRLECRRVPAADLQLAPCEAGEALTSDGRTVSCVRLGGEPPSPGYRERLRDLAWRVAQVRALLLPHERTPGPGAVFVGTTGIAVRGRIARPGHTPGLPSAHAYCADHFGPGAHMCSVHELHGSVRAGTLRPGMEVPRSWIYMPAGKDPPPASSHPDEGLADTCGGYTVDAATPLSFSGVAMEWTALPTGPAGLKLHGGDGAACTQALPIACCR